jgi:NRAMP (natural resistance-associated macrophage protein)-like metal ion transporter
VNARPQSASINAEDRSPQRPTLWERLGLFLLVMGPGLIVMLADTDAGSLITAAQSGAQWGYTLITLQLILIPILFMVQELTVRLGLHTGRGHGELIRETFGGVWAWISVGTLLVSCVGALVTEMVGMAGAGQLYGIPIDASVWTTVLFLLLVVVTGSYRSVELVATLVGLFEIALFYVAYRAHPQMGLLARGLVTFPLGHTSYLYLVAANIGAVIMPWMVFYQQAAVVDKKLKGRHIGEARIDTLIGAFLTQAIMIAMIVAAAATIGRADPHASLNDVPEISRTLTSFLGQAVGRAVFAVGIIGASLVAAIVVSLTAAWGLGEVSGYRRSLNHRLHEAPWFYLVYALALVAGALLVTSGVNLVRLSVGIEVMNALLLPIVLGFLYLLARRALPPEHRLRGRYAVLVLVLIVLTVTLGVYGGLQSLF